MLTPDSPAGVAQNNIMGQAQLSAEEPESGDDVFTLEQQLPKRNTRAPPTPEPDPLEPNTSTGPTMLANCRRLIQDRSESLYKLFTGVDDPFLHRLEDAGKCRGGPKAVLGRLAGIAHQEFKQQRSDDFKGDDGDMERKRSGGDEDYSRNLLECICRMMIVEAGIQKSSSNGSQAGKNGRKTACKISPGGLSSIREVSGDEISIYISSDFEGSDREDEPVPVVKYKAKKRRTQQGEKQDGGNMFLQCCNDMVR